MEFVSFPKIPRLKRGIVITEKIDGTNAQVFIRPVPHPFDWDAFEPPYDNIVRVDDERCFFIRAGSRNRWVAPGKDADNAGFAAWVLDNLKDLTMLGPGRHFGEWWGKGIQRTYDMPDKRFSLFNVTRYGEGREQRPVCCGVVPVLYEGAFSDTAIDTQMKELAERGSFASTGYMKPEGIVIYHSASRSYFKRTFEHDEEGKEQSDRNN